MPISLVCSPPFLKVKTVAMKQGQPRQRPTIWSTATSAKTRMQGDNDQDVVDKQNKQGDYKRWTKDPLPLVGDLYFDMLDQKYEMGKKHSDLHWLHRCSYMFLTPWRRRRQSQGDPQLGYISTPLLSLVGYIHILSWNHITEGHFSSDTLGLPVALGGRVRPLQLSWDCCVEHNLNDRRSGHYYHI